MVRCFFLYQFTPLVSVKYVWKVKRFSRNYSAFEQNIVLRQSEVAQKPSLLPLREWPEHQKTLIDANLLLEKMVDQVTKRHSKELQNVWSCHECPDWRDFRKIWMSRIWFLIVASNGEIISKICYGELR